MRIILLVIPFLLFCLTAVSADNSTKKKTMAQIAKENKIALSKSPQLVKDFWQEWSSINKELASKCILKFNERQNTFYIKYNLREYQVYVQKASGDISKELTTLQGPESDGFEISLSIRKGKYNGSVGLPCSIHKFYWKQYANYYDLADNTHVMFGIDFGAKQRKMIKVVNNILSKQLKNKNP